MMGKNTNYTLGIKLVIKYFAEHFSDIVPDLVPRFGDFAQLWKEQNCQKAKSQLAGKKTLKVISHISNDIKDLSRRCSSCALSIPSYIFFHLQSFTGEIHFYAEQGSVFLLANSGVYHFSFPPLQWEPQQQELTYLLEKKSFFRVQLRSTDSARFQGETYLAENTSLCELLVASYTLSHTSVHALACF